MPRPSAAALVLLALAALLAGCAPSSSDSAGDFRGDQRAVADVVEDLESAASDGDENRICRDLLAPALARRLSPQGGCAAAVDTAIKNSDTFALDVESVRIAGDRAIARVKFETGDTDRFGTVTLTRPRASAGWRIEQLATAGAAPAR